MKAAVILFVLGLATAAYGLKCKSCVHCEDIKKETPTVTCSKENAISPATKIATLLSNQPISRADGDDDDTKYQCIKATTALGEGFIVIRGCTTLTECKTDEKLITACDLCDTDECNFAPGMKSWALSSVLLIAIIKMFL